MGLMSGLAQEGRKERNASTADLFLVCSFVWAVLLMYMSKTAPVIKVTSTVVGL